MRGAPATAARRNAVAFPLGTGFDVILLRHAQSWENAHVGPTAPDSGLTPLGIKQAADLADCLPQGVQHVISSPLARSSATADAILRRFPDAKRSIWDVQEFAYAEPAANPEGHDGRTQLKETYWSDADADFRTNDLSESFSELLHRIDAFHEALAVSEPGLTVVVSHKYFIKGTLWRSLRGNGSQCLDVQRFSLFSRSLNVRNGDALFGRVKTNAAVHWGKLLPLLSKGMRT